MVHFHLSLSGCGMGSLETCTHVILMPKSHLPHYHHELKFFEPELFPIPQSSDKNVAISDIGRKIAKNVVTSGMHKPKR